MGGQRDVIAAAVFTGLSVGVVMATLGAALGLSVSATAVDRASKAIVTADGAGDAAVGLIIGAGVWLLITAVAVGIASGLALSRMSHQERPYAPRPLGVATRALCLCIVVLFAASSPGVPGRAPALGVAGAAKVASETMQSLEAGFADVSDARDVDTRHATGREDGVQNADASW